MKKLLTILTLALALCLVCSSALAVEYKGNFDETSLTAALNSAADDYGMDPAGRTFKPTVANLLKMDHEVRTMVEITGKKAGETVTIEAFVTMQHTWKKVDAKSTEPTCTEAGSYYYECTKEGCTGSKTETVAALGHTMVHKDTATCGAKGYEYDVCTRCGFIAKDELGNEIKVEKPATGAHKPKDDKGKEKYTFVAPHCGYPDGQFETRPDWVKGYYYQVCTVCGKPIKADGTEATVDDVKVVLSSITNYQNEYKAKMGKEITVDGHSWDKSFAKTEPTCYSGATEKKWCKVCGLEVTRTIADSKPLDPVWILDPDVTCETLDYGQPANFICKNCGKDDSPAHSKRPATYVYDVDLANLKYGYKVTATIDGVDYSASVYHKLKVENTEYHIGAKYHNSLDEFSKAELKNWCSSGWKHTQYVCTACDHTFGSYESAPFEHVWTEWEVAVGKDEHGTETTRWESHCVYCEQLRTKPLADKPVDPCKPNEHVWKPEDPTKVKCEDLNEGTKLICSVCGEKKTDKYPLKHAWEDVSVIEAATCTKAGSKIQKCTNPGCSVKLQIVEIPVIAHTPVDVAEVPATCQKEGTKAGKKCSVCGEKLEGFEKIPVDEKAHVWTEEELVAPTCEKVGTGLKTCSVCKKVEKYETPALGHKWDEGKVTKEATKEAKGDMTYTCTVCGKTDVKEGVVDYVITADPKYSVTALSYDGQSVKGKLVHDEDTLEATNINVRVTFFIEGNYYMATIGEVAADGSFSVDGVGPIEYISVLATGSSSVNPEDVKAMGAGEITVK